MSMLGLRLFPTSMHMSVRRTCGGWVGIIGLGARAQQEEEGWLGCLPMAGVPCLAGDPAALMPGTQPQTQPKMSSAPTLSDNNHKPLNTHLEVACQSVQLHLADGGACREVAGGRFGRGGASGV